MKELEALGLSHNETLVYEALLELGESTTGPITKHAKLHRPQVYDALDALIDKGLASYVIKENIKYFQASDPERIKDFLREKEELADSIIPKLQLLQKENAAKQQVMLYEGIRGLKSAMNNMLHELADAGEHAVFASGNMAPTMGAYYDQYQEYKRTHDIKTLVIYDESFREHADIIDRTAGNIRFSQITSFPTDTWIYNDKVLIVTYTANPPVAILIISQETANSYRKLFDGFWRQAKK